MLNISNNPSNNLFLSLLDAEIQNLSERNHFGQAQKIQSARKSFCNFLTTRGQADITLSELTVHIICDYQQWLEQRGVMKNSSSCYMRTLQSVYNKSVATLTDWQQQPFAKVYRGIAKTKKRATTINMMKCLKSLDLRQGLIALGKNPRRKTFQPLLHKLMFVRDIFIFSYCARGMAFVDVAYLRKRDIRHGVIHYARRKTGQHIEVAVEPLMQEIIERYADECPESPYLFPILRATDEATAYRCYRSALRTYNEYLKMIATMLGGDVNLTSYVARHSWASNMHELNAPMAIISEGLGHDSEITTQIYIKSLESNEIHRANKAFINQIFSPRFLTEEREDFMTNCLRKEHKKHFLPQIMRRCTCELCWNPDF